MHVSELSLKGQANLRDFSLSTFNLLRNTNNMLITFCRNFMFLVKHVGMAKKRQDVMIVGLPPVFYRAMENMLQFLSDTAHDPILPNYRYSIMVTTSVIQCIELVCATQQPKTGTFQDLFIPGILINILWKTMEICPQFLYKRFSLKVRRNQVRQILCVGGTREVRERSGVFIYPKLVSPQLFSYNPIKTATYSLVF